jgi:hypothetical protein
MAEIEKVYRCFLPERPAPVFGFNTDHRSLAEDGSRTAVTINFMHPVEDRRF